MWKKINNYKFHLKDLKFMTWLFQLSVCYMPMNSFLGYCTTGEVRWLKLICMAIMIIGFIDIRKSLKQRL